MSAPAATGKKKKRGGHGGDHADERWLLTYADMLTLMFALFMVLFSISSVNISKYQTLQKSLKSAFSGSILPGGRAIMQAGSMSSSAREPSSSDVPSIVPLNPVQSRAAQFRQIEQALGNAAQQGIDNELATAEKAIAAANAEQQDFQQLKAALTAFAKRNGFSNQVQVAITKDGLVINVLTDRLLFDSGSAVIKPQGQPLLAKVAQLLNLDSTHPITVAGHTDNQPIDTAEFPSNWVLSSVRAVNVVEFLIAHGVNPQRLSAAGYGDTHSIATNATAAGRAQNRRVEILIQRLNPYPMP